MLEPSGVFVDADIEPLLDDKALATDGSELWLVQVPIDVSDTTQHRKIKFLWDFSPPRAPHICVTYNTCNHHVGPARLLGGRRVATKAKRPSPAGRGVGSERGSLPRKRPPRKPDDRSAPSRAHAKVKNVRVRLVRASTPASDLARSTPRAAHARIGCRWSWNSSRGLSSS